MKIIDINNEKYPNRLKLIKDSPKKLYVEGNEKILNSYCISIIGSRKCTQYGINCCNDFVKEIAKYGVTIVSGMAIRN